MSVEEAGAGKWGENVRVRFLHICLIFIVIFKCTFSSPGVKGTFFIFMLCILMNNKDLFDLISQEMLQAGAVKGCVWIWLQQFLSLHMHHKLSTEVRSTPSLALAKYKRCRRFKVYVHTLHTVTCPGAHFWTLCPENVYGYSCCTVVQHKGTFTKWHHQNNQNEKQRLGSKWPNLHTLLPVLAHLTFTFTSWPTMT